MNEFQWLPKVDPHTFRQSWRIKIVVLLGEPESIPKPHHSIKTSLRLVPWSFFTSDVAKTYCNIKDIRKGRPTRISVPSLLGGMKEVDGWVNKVSFCIEDISYTLIKRIEVCFIDSYIDIGYRYGVVGMDILQYLKTLLDGQAKATIFKEQ